MPTYNAPSLKKLVKTFPTISTEQATAIRKEIHAGNKHTALDIFDTSTGNYGVEYIQSLHDTPRHPQGIAYSNTGEVYSATLLYDYKTATFRISTIGDTAKYRKDLI